MKMLFIVCVLLASIMLCCGQDISAIRFSIRGSVSKNYEGQLIYLRSNKIKDSCVIINGKFNFQHKIKCPALGVLILVKQGQSINSEQRQVLPIYLDQGDIHVKSKDSLHKAKVSGSLENNRFLVFSKMIRPVQEMYKNINSKKQEQNIVDNEVKQIQIEQMLEAAREKEAEVIAQFIRKYPHSYVGLYALNSAGIGKTANPFVFEKLFEELDSKVKESDEGKELLLSIRNAQNQFAEHVALTFSMPDTAGKILNIKDVRSKYILLDFWASWCIPCRQQFPALKQIYDSVDRGTFEIIGISLDRTKHDWVRAIQQDSIKWIHTSELNGSNNTIARFFGVNGIPYNLLIDARGKILERNLDPVRLSEKLKSLAKMSADNSN